MNVFKYNRVRIHTIRVQNSLDPDQDQHIAGPGFGPNCFQRLSVGGRSTCNHTSVSYLEQSIFIAMESLI